MTPLMNRRVILAVLLMTVVPLWPIIPWLMALALTGKLDSWIVKGPVVAMGKLDSETREIRFVPQSNLRPCTSQVIALPFVNKNERKAHRFWQRK